MNYDIIKILNLEDFSSKILDIKPISTSNSDLNYIITLVPNKNISCPVCGCIECKIKDYVSKNLIHSFHTNKKCNLIYRARRYKCSICNKIFYEENLLSDSKERLSTFTSMKILEEIKDYTTTFSSVGRRLNVSVTTVISVFDRFVTFSKSPSLPRIISLDEIYKSKKNGEKYAFIIVDFLKVEVFNVLNSRKSDYILREFSSYPIEERNKVEYITIDMSENFYNCAKTYFSNAVIAVDSFHVLKNIADAFKTIRLRIQNYYKFKRDPESKNINDHGSYYYMLYKFKWLLVKRFDRIKDIEYNIYKFGFKWTKTEIRSYLLDIDEGLKEAYWILNDYLEFNYTAKYETCRDELDALIKRFYSCKAEEFSVIGRTLSHWKEQIINSFIRIDARRLSNGPIEGLNSKIKVIIHNGNGYKNFDRLRRKIMYSLNKNYPIKGIHTK